MTLTKRRLRAGTSATALALAALVTGACSSEHEDGSDAGADPTSSISVEAGADHNAADVLFAQQMIPHHAQALAMTDLFIGRTLSPDLTALGDTIREAQGPEIETMTGWLFDWHQEVPETVRDHENSHGGHDASSPAASGGASEGAGDQAAAENHDMAGMMTEAEMADLEAATGAEFESMWLEMMIRHHEGAVTMARAELEDGKFAAAKELAQEVIAGQQAEIDQMKALLEE